MGTSGQTVRRMTLHLHRLLSFLFVLKMIHCRVHKSDCTFLCGDGFTCLPAHQVCDQYYDCPMHEGGEGGEDEEVCSSSSGEDEEEDNQVDRNQGLGVPDISSICHGAQSSLVADPNDCRVFYHCMDLFPQAQNCGELMFNNKRQVCDWPMKVMQIRPECRDPASFIFRHGPNSWDARRTHRMISWLGGANPQRLAKVRVRVNPERHRMIHHPSRNHQRTIYQRPSVRTSNVPIQDQQRSRTTHLDSNPITHPITPPNLGFPSQEIQEAPRPHVVRIQSGGVQPGGAQPPKLVLPSQEIQEAPRPHVVRIQSGGAQPWYQHGVPSKQYQNIKQHIISKQQEAPLQQLHQQIPQQNIIPPQAPESQVITRHRISPQYQDIKNRIISQQQLATQQRTPPQHITPQHQVTPQAIPPKRVSQQYQEQNIITQQQPQQFVSPQRIIPQRSQGEELTFIITNLLEDRIRQSLSQSFTDQVAKQTKIKQEPVKRVTHTVTSTSSQVSGAPPSHHYVQDSVIGNSPEKKYSTEKKKEQKKKKYQEKKNFQEQPQQEVEEPEQEQEQEQDITEDIIISQLTPVLVEDIREHKPIWTVTRERPTNRKRLRMKVRRKLTSDEKIRMKERRRTLLNPVLEDHTEEEPLLEEIAPISFDLNNAFEDDDSLNEDELQSISLKEHYDMHIKKIDEDEEGRDPGSRLLEMMLDNIEEQKYEDYSNEEEQYKDYPEEEIKKFSDFSNEERQYLDSSQIRE